MSKQFREFKKNAGKTALTLALVGMTATSASAAGKTALTTANLNMRTQGNTNSKIILTIPKGETVNVVEQGKSWSKVEYKGKQGYSYNRYLKEVITQTVNVELKVNTKESNLNVRTGPSTNFKVIGNLKKGATVKASAKVDGWYKINFKGQVGYISGEYVKIINGSTNNGGTNNGEVSATGTMRVTASSLRIRKGAGTDTATIGYLDRGEEVKVLGKTNNGWVKIQDKNGVVGYCSAKYLEEVSNGTETGTVKPMTGKVEVVGATNLNVRAGAGTGYKVITTVPGGTVLEVTGQHSNGWYQVKLANGTVGFISNKYASVVKEEVVKDEAPVITVERTEVTREQGSAFARGGYIGVTADAWGAKATDKEDGDLTDKIEVIGDDNIAKVGTRDITLQVKDSAGNVTKKVVKLTVTEAKEEEPETPAPQPPVEEEKPVVPPTQPPVEEEKPVVPPTQPPVEEEKPEEKPPVEEEKPEEKPPVEEDKPEEKPPVDIQKPEVINAIPTLSAKEDLVLTVGDNFDIKQLEIKALDKEDGDLIDKVEVTNNVNTSVAGEYKVILKVTDSKGASATKTIIVTVKEKEVPPVVNEAPTMTVKNPVVAITEGGNFSIDAFGAVAQDKEDGTLKVTLEGNYDVNKPGTYNLTLVSEDSKGLEVRVNVKLVVEERVNTAPKVTANSIEINKGDNFSYDMLGAKATDAEGDKVTITYEGTVNTTTAGKYTIKVVATDDRGASSSVNVTVTVNEVAQGNYDPNSAAFKQAVLNKMVALVNDHRVANGKKPYSVANRLVNSANIWSKHMADNGQFDHVVNGKDVQATFPELGPISSENIAIGTLIITGDMEQDAINLANQLFTMWKNSAGHNANMLSSLMTQFGFGFHAVSMGPEGTNYQIWATQHCSRTGDTANASEDIVEEEIQEEVKEEEVVVEEETVQEEVKEEVKEEVQAPVVEEQPVQEEVQAPVVEEPVQEEVKEETVVDETPVVDETVTEGNVEITDEITEGVQE